MAPAAVYTPYVEAFKGDLRSFGYAEGSNIVLEYRWAEGKDERLPDLAAELVRLNMDVIVTHGTPATLSAKKATTVTIPIIMISIAEPVASGIVASLARPGGNVTGLSTSGRPSSMSTRSSGARNLPTCPSSSRPGSSWSSISEPPGRSAWRSLSRFWCARTG